MQMSVVLVLHRETKFLKKNMKDTSKAYHRFISLQILFRHVLVWYQAMFWEAL